MKRLSVCFALMTVPFLAWSQAKLPTDVKNDAIVQLEAGVICAPASTETRPAPDTLAGTTHVIDEDPPFVSNARRVPAVLGIGFGVKSVGSAANGLDDVTMVVTHPAMGAQKIETQTYGTFISSLSSSLTFYQFDYNYELLPGIWNMTAMQGETVLYSVNFEVLPPEQVPELASVCGFESLLS